MIKSSQTSETWKKNIFESTTSRLIVPFRTRTLHSRWNCQNIHWTVIAQHRKASQINLCASRSAIEVVFFHLIRFDRMWRYRLRWPEQETNRKSEREWCILLACVCVLSGLVSVSSSSHFLYIHFFCVFSSLIVFFSSFHFTSKTNRNEWKLFFYLTAAISAGVRVLLALFNIIQKNWTKKEKIENSAEEGN